MNELSEAGAYDLDRIRAALGHDRATVADLLEALPPEAEDGKVAALLGALEPAAGRIARRRAGPRAAQGRLIFTQFRDTARYLSERLAERGSRTP